MKNKAVPISMPAMIGRMMFMVCMFYKEDEGSEELL
jgi:hypothetical protein